MPRPPYHSYRLLVPGSVCPAGSNSCPLLSTQPACRASALLSRLRPASVRNRLASELTQCASASQSLRPRRESRAAEITARHSVRTQWASWVSGRSPVPRACVCLSVSLSDPPPAACLPAAAHGESSLPFSLTLSACSGLSEPRARQRPARQPAEEYTYRFCPC